MRLFYLKGNYKKLVITDYDTKENKDRIMKVGADDYLAKPLNRKTLLQHIKNLLNSKGNLLKSD